jgi:hypothetical protein
VTDHPAYSMPPLPTVAELAADALALQNKYERLRNWYVTHDPSVLKRVQFYGAGGYLAAVVGHLHNAAHDVEMGWDQTDGMTTETDGT